jgi:hypothetical protein
VKRPHLGACSQARWVTQGKGELSYRTWKDPRCSIIFMPRIKARPGRIGKSSYGLRRESYRLWMLSHQSLGRRFGFLRPLKWPGMAEISPLKGSSLGSSTKALLKKSSIYQFDSVIVHFRAGIARWRHDDLTSNLFGSDARVDTVACRVGIVASRTSAR